MTKIAAVQMCSSHIIDDNLNTAVILIAEAANQGAKLIVLPEMFAIMGLTDNDKILSKEVFLNGPIQSFLSEQAKKNKVWIIGGTIPIESENNPKKIKAASLVFDDTGNFIDRYDKIHLFDTTISQNEKYNESNTTDPGDKVVLINTPFGKIGLAVCYDLRFPELFRYLFNMGAEIFVVPSAFTTTTGQAHWELLTRSRAVENFCYLIGACQGGTHANGRKTYGNSIIVDPWGTIIAHKDAIQPGIIYADIDLDKLYEIRKSIPVNRHQRIFFDMSQLK